MVACVCAHSPFLFASIITPGCTHLIWLYSKSKIMLTEIILVNSVVTLICHNFFFNNWDGNYVLSCLVVEEVKENIRNWYSEAKILPLPRVLGNQKLQHWNAPKTLTVFVSEEVLNWSEGIFNLVHVKIYVDLQMHYSNSP